MIFRELITLQIFTLQKVYVGRKATRPTLGNFIFIPVKICYGLPLVGKLVKWYIVSVHCREEGCIGKSIHDKRCPDIFQV